MRAFLAVLALVVVGLGALGVLLYVLQAEEHPTTRQQSATLQGTSTTGQGKPRTETVELEHTDYHPPAAEPEELLTDDRLEDKKPSPFDPALVDRRPFGARGEWLLNSSAAVLRLDVPMILPDQEPNLLTLHPSYAAAVGPNPAARNILPSVNLADGKAKQFDDGLYAVLDQAYYQGLQNKLFSHIRLVRRLYEKVGKDSPAAPFLAAGLELAHVSVEPTDKALKEGLLIRFRENEVLSRPIGFYTWNESLGDCFRFLRFFQTKFTAGNLTVPLAIGQALAQDQFLRADYQKALDFYARLTNPYTGLSVADIAGRKSVSLDELGLLCQQKQVKHPTVSLFPASTSRETVLFEDLFLAGVPENANLMRELIKHIRSGKVNLQPGPGSGWYDYQAYALETLLLPEKGEERDKLMLTRAYKKRMLEAFQALITKRRETHVRQLDITNAPTAAPPPPREKIKPRLRVEPCPSYFLRTARAYAFLANFLESVVGRETLVSLHGLKNEGPRKQNLDAELAWMRDLFYGLYLISAEDLGLAPTLAADEPVQRDRCYALAAEWLAKAFQDEDLAADTRVGVPVIVDTERQVARLWLTLGVRLSKLDVRYARPPSLKPAQTGTWQTVPADQLEPVQYLIPVDEFAEVDLHGLKVLTREELRAVCDREKTKAAIVDALQR
jgi:hypothetical protein